MVSALVFSSRRSVVWTVQPSGIGSSNAELSVTRACPCPSRPSSVGVRLHRTSEDLCDVREAPVPPRRQSVSGPTPSTPSTSSPRHAIAGAGRELGEVLTLSLSPGVTIGHPSASHGPMAGPAPLPWRLRRVRSRGRSPPRAQAGLDATGAGLLREHTSAVSFLFHHPVVVKIEPEGSPAANIERTSWLSGSDFRSAATHLFRRAH